MYYKRQIEMAFAHFVLHHPSGEIKICIPLTQRTRALQAPHNIWISRKTCTERNYIFFTIYEFLVDEMSTFVWPSIFEECAQHNEWNRVKSHIIMGAVMNLSMMRDIWSLLSLSKFYHSLSLFFTHGREVGTKSLREAARFLTCGCGRTKYFIY